MEALPNLASPLLGAEVVFATDEWFAAADNMLKDEDPIWLANEYTSFGKWMDGWESRRRRTEGHDWCIVRLGLPGVVKCIEFNTAFFTGNFSPKVSVFGSSESEEDRLVVEELVRVRKESVGGRDVDVGRMGLCASEEEWRLVEKLRSDRWDRLVGLSPLGSSCKSLFSVESCSAESVCRLLRVNMGPDGGIARMRVSGRVAIRLEDVPFDEDIDLAAVERGGVALQWSDKHYGHPRNLIAPGRGNCMGDGWETARQPTRPAVYERGEDGLIVLPGCDWAVLQLGLRGVVNSLEVDTHFYKGNYPESVIVEGRSAEDEEWKVLLPRSRLGPDAIHRFSVSGSGVVSQVKVTIFPDGGIMRLRVIGRKARDSRL